MTDEQIEATIESIRVDAEHDIEDFRRLYLTMVVLKAQRDALAETLKSRLSSEGFNSLVYFTEQLRDK